MYKLTEEGKNYLENGLPEKRLLKLIGNEKPLEEVSKFPKFQIAVGWAKRNAWIEIENKTVKITELGKKTIDEKTKIEKALEDINEKGETEQELAKTLLSRSLISETKDIIEKKLSLWQRIINFFFKEKEEKLKEIKEVAQLTPDLIKTGEWKNKTFRKYDIGAPAPKIYAGKKQPYVQFIEDIRERLIGLGFQEMRGPLVEMFFWNSDALFMPQDHPARGIHDVLILKNPDRGKLIDENLVAKVKATHEGGWITESSGWGGSWSKMNAEKLIMRSQGTAVSARTMHENQDKPAKYFFIDKVFRYDVIDARHLMEFDHCEGIVIGEKLTFRHLLGFLKEIAEAVGAKEVKFKPDYFPFTSPSCEMLVKHPKIGWVEAAGAGLMRPEVLRPLGLEKSEVLAWGIGLGRLAMINLGVDDIRMLYSDDLDWLRKTPLVK
jgi:phenylalanyl-tRNA synthetase alpha chain